MNQQEKIAMLREALVGMLGLKGFGCGDGSDHQVETYNIAVRDAAWKALEATEQPASEAVPIGYVSISALEALNEFTAEGMPNSIRLYNQ